MPPGGNATPDIATSNDREVLGEQSIERPTSSKDERPSLEDGTLLITDTTLLAQHSTYFAAAHPEAEVIAVENLGEFYEAMRKYKSIKKLIIFCHSSASDLKFNTQQEAMSDINDMFESQQPATVQVSGEVIFDGCNIGHAVDELFRTRGILGAESVTAWNYFHLVDSISIPNPPNEAWIRDFVYPNYGDYLTEFAPSEEALLAAPGGYPKIYYEVFIDNVPDNPRLPTLQENPARSDIYKRRQDKRRETIVTEERASDVTDILGISAWFTEVVIKANGR